MAGTDELVDLPGNGFRFSVHFRRRKSAPKADAPPDTAESSQTSRGTTSTTGVNPLSQRKGDLPALTRQLTR
jgi:hypothetical protein